MVPGVSYPVVLERTLERIQRVSNMTRRTVYLQVDATGVGMGPVQQLEERGLLGNVLLSPVWFTGTQRIEQAGSEWRVGKMALVKRLNVLLDSERLWLPDHPNTADLIRELQDYERRITDSANEIAGAFKTGAHDDLVAALGLACIDDTLTEPITLGPNLWE